ncbi:hypothetical protein J0H58_02945 [bacterium]|nr:hypothetical protein [bacterium]
MSEQVRINGVAVFAYSQDGRLRLSLDDWERLGLVPGQQVLVGEHRQLLVSAEEHPPFVWLRLQPLSRKVG